MYDDVKDVVGKEYVTKHISTKMRNKGFRATIAGTAMTFMVIAKIDQNFLTRDILKLKQKIAHIIVAKTHNRQIDAPYQTIYQEILTAVHDKQVHEMGNNIIF
jgi:hypothetical protein